MMLFVLILGLFFLVVSEKKLSKIQRLSFLIPVILLIILIFTIPQVKNRFLIEVTSNIDIVNQEKYSYDTPFTGTT
jgi:hypothetical protein